MNAQNVSEKVCKERCKAFDDRLDKVEQAQEHLAGDQSSIAMCLTKLTVLCENSMAHAEKLDQRVFALETRGSRIWDKILVGALTGALGTLLGYLLQPWLS